MSSVCVLQEQEEFFKKAGVSDDVSEIAAAQTAQTAAGPSSSLCVERVDLWGLHSSQFRGLTLLPASRQPCRVIAH